MMSLLFFSSEYCDATVFPHFFNEMHMDYDAVSFIFMLHYHFNSFFEDL